MTTLYTGITCPDPSFIHTPLIEIRPVSDDSMLREEAGRVDSYDYLLFTSRFAVEPFVRCLPAKALPEALPRTVAIGKTTARALREAGFTQVEQAGRADSYGVISWFSRQPKGSVLIPRSSLALGIIPDGLRQMGFGVTTVVAYENHIPEHPVRADLSTIDRIVFTSPSTIDNFLRVYGSLPGDKEYVTQGAITEQYLQTIIKRQQL